MIPVLSIAPGPVKSFLVAIGARIIIPKMNFQLSLHGIYISLATETRSEP